MRRKAPGFTCRFFLAALALAAGVGQSDASVGWITLRTKEGTEVRSMLGVPGRPGKLPAVIFNHGTDVRQYGYERAVFEGKTDVREFVDALVAEGFVVLAPIREFLANVAYLDRGRLAGSPEDWTNVIARGLGVMRAAVRYLENHPRVKPGVMGIVGYSEGGNLALWTAIEGAAFRAVVLLSPAAIPVSPRYSLRAASDEILLAKIKVPVFLAVGEQDFEGIRAMTARFLIPNMQKLNKAFVSKNYAGAEHNWFFRARDKYWRDVTEFLNAHLPR